MRNHFLLEPPLNLAGVAGNLFAIRAIWEQVLTFASKKTYQISSKQSGKPSTPTGTKIYKLIWQRHRKVLQQLSCNEYNIVIVSKCLRHRSRGLRKCYESSLECKRRLYTSPNTQAVRRGGQNCTSLRTLRWSCVSECTHWQRLILHSRHDLAQILLNNGANTDWTTSTDSRDSILRRAVEQSNKCAVEFPLQHGADIGIPDTVEISPVRDVRIYRNETILGPLLESREARKALR